MKGEAGRHMRGHADQVATSKKKLQGKDAIIDRLNEANVQLNEKLDEASREIGTQARRSKLIISTNIGTRFRKHIVISSTKEISYWKLKVIIKSIISNIWNNVLMAEIGIIINWFKKSIKSRMKSSSNMKKMHYKIEEQ
jgi:hypothetical protein